MVKVQYKTGLISRIVNSNIHIYSLTHKVFLDAFCPHSRLTGRNHTVQDGWFTLAISRTYPKPSSLPDLRIVTEPIKWDESWSTFQTKTNAALR